MHVGVFGGSFDPPHTGHLIVAEWMRDAFDLDEVLWIPAARSPHKADRSPAPDTLRLAMVEAATADNPRFEVSDIEIRRGGLSYTVDTLHKLRESRPDATFSLMMGSDSLASFPRWRDPGTIVELVDILVYLRPGDQEPALPEWLASRVRMTRAPLLEVSASEIRRRCAVGRSIRYLVPASVEAVIQEHALYR
jgi:nicotinate-nucleotide adenylyltransferase